MQTFASTSCCLLAFLFFLFYFILLYSILCWETALLGLIPWYYSLSLSLSLLGLFRKLKIVVLFNLSFPFSLYSQILHPRAKALSLPPFAPWVWFFRLFLFLELSVRKIKEAAERKYSYFFHRFLWAGSLFSGPYFSGRSVFYLHLLGEFFFSFFFFFGFIPLLSALFSFGLIGW